MVQAMCASSAPVDIPAARVTVPVAATGAAGVPAPGAAAPTSAEGWKDAGNAHFKAGRFQQAEACYSRSLELAPTCLAHANRALARLKLGRPAEAEADCAAALALDLMEEFRFFADRLALSLINRGQLDADDFVEREGGAVLLEGDARKAVVVAWQERKQEELTHPLLEQTVPLGVVPLIQARLLARSLRGEMPEYLPFVIR